MGRSKRCTDANCAYWLYDQCAFMPSKNNPRPCNEPTSSRTECIWTHDDHLDYYATACNSAHSFTHGDINSNRHQFCPYCGRKIKEAK